jgi:hypothetical protein
LRATFKFSFARCIPPTDSARGFVVYFLGYRLKLYSKHFIFFGTHE